jgi:hypothetical protein
MRRKYTEVQRREILLRAHSTLARLRMEEAIEGLRQERLELAREVAHDRAFQQLQLERKRWLADHERRQRGGNGLIYKVKLNARIR